MPDVKKIAALAMLELSEAEAAQLSRDVAEILGMGQTMPAADAEIPAARTVETETLREDLARDDGRGAALTALSKKERDGFITVSRTVGGGV